VTLTHSTGILVMDLVLYLIIVVGMAYFLV